MKKKLNINTKQTSFKVPEGYFDTLETRLMDTIKKTSPRDMKVDSGFTVPENYFESFKVETDKSPVILWKKTLYLSGIAAAFVLMFTFFVPKKQPTFDSIETATLENYLLNTPYTSTDLADLLDAEELSPETFGILIDPQEMEAFIMENVSIENLSDF